jgi:hypothetical protein
MLKPLPSKKTTTMETARTKTKKVVIVVVKVMLGKRQKEVKVKM